MQRKGRINGIFVFLLILTFLILLSVRTPVFTLFSSGITGLFSPIRSSFNNSFLRLVSLSGDEKLKEENLDLRKKVVDIEKLKKDNQALKDQFSSTKIKSTALIPASVIGSPGFFPGVSAPEFIILDKGQGDGVMVGSAVVYKDNVIGKISKATSNSSVVSLITNNSISFEGQTGEDGKVLGVLKGLGNGEIIFDNVLLAETLKTNDLILTKGDIDSSGKGFPPGLIVGKIISVEKNPSALFQKAEIRSFIDFTRLGNVFIFSK